MKNISFYKNFHWVSMSIGLSDIGSISVFLILRFGSVDKIQTANQTKPCGCVKKWSEYIQTKCGFLQFRIGSVCGFSIGLVRFWTPLVHTTKKIALLPFKITHFLNYVQCELTHVKHFPTWVNSVGMWMRKNKREKSNFPRSISKFCMIELGVKYLLFRCLNNMNSF